MSLFSCLQNLESSLLLFELSIGICFSYYLIYITYWLDNVSIQFVYVCVVQYALWCFGALVAVAAVLEMAEAALSAA